MKFTDVAPIVVVLTFVRIASAASPITDLSATIGPTVGVLGINDAGVMVGSQKFEGGGKDDTVAMFWAPGKPPKSLGSFGRGQAVAQRVNKSNVVVGMANADGCPRAFVYTPSAAMKDLGTFGGGYSWANDVNDAGVVVGWASDEEGKYLPFRWRGGKAIERLHTPSGTGGGWANGINARGDIVGHFDTPLRHPKRHAFLLRARGGAAMQDLGTLGGSNSDATKINDAGVLVGWSDLAGDTVRHAFRCDAADGKLIDLGVLPGHTRSSAFAINNANVIVGTSSPPGEEDARTRRAVAWLPDGAPIDLTAWLRKVDRPNGKRWEIRWPAAINAANQIVGYGDYDADGDGKHETPRPFLLDVTSLVKQ